MLSTLPIRTEYFTTGSTQRLGCCPSWIRTREVPCFSVLQPRNSYAVSQCNCLVTPKYREGVTSLLHIQRSTVLKLQKCSLADQMIHTLTPYCVLWFCLCCSAHPQLLLSLIKQSQTVSITAVSVLHWFHPSHSGWTSAHPRTAVLFF